jgi:hypothetical protein
MSGPASWPECPGPDPIRHPHGVETGAVELRWRCRTASWRQR